MNLLELVADRQAVWSATANALKARVETIRHLTFALSFIGALAAACASALSVETGRHYLTLIGTVALALATFLTMRFLRSQDITAHIRARAASEALKRIAFLYATEAEPLADPLTRDGAMKAMLGDIEKGVTDLALEQRRPSGKGSCPRQPLDFSDYAGRRLQGQIDYYRNSADALSVPSRYLHVSEFALAGIAAIVTAIAGFQGKGAFDFTAMTAVLTTVAGIVLAHIQAERYDERIVIYRAAANRLEELKATTAASASAATLAAACEAIIAAETNSWQAIWQGGTKA